MYVEQVIIDGFKSYSMRTEVGPFDPQFTAITGLNGSGKSNILDSICFVLGISNLSLVRCTNLQELVYKQGQAGIVKASVTIVFNNSDPKMRPHGYETEKIHVTREIVVGGKNKYKINSHVVQQNQVQNLFHSVQLNVNNPHFLIMQGRITKVINMKPAEILGMLEETAGTKMYETKKQQSEKLIEKKELKVKEISDILQKEIQPTLEKLATERQNYLKWASLNNEVEKLHRFVTASEYLSYEGMVNDCDEEMKKYSDKLEQVKKEEAEAAEQQKACEDRINEIIRSRQDENSRQLEKLMSLENTVKKEIVQEESKLKHKKATAEELEGKIKDQKAQVEKANQAYKKAEAKVNEKEKAAKEAEENQGNLDAELERLEKSLSNLNAGMDDGGEGAQSLQHQLMEAQNKAARLKTDEVAATNALQIARKQLVTAEKEFEHVKKEGKEVKQSIGGKEKDVEKKKKALDDLKFDHRQYGAVEAKHRQEKMRTEEVRAKVAQHENNLERLNFNYNKPNSFDASRVKGVVAKLIQMKPEFHRYATAVEVAAGGRLFMVVVDNENTAKTLLDTPGCMRKRVTLIPLNKIDTRTTADAQVQKAKSIVPSNEGEVFHALEVVGSHKEVENAMKYVFGNVLIADSPDTAKLVTFHPQVRVRSVTKEGDVYDPAGTVEGGSAPRSGQLLARLEELRTLHKHLKEREDKLAAVAKEWADINSKKEECDARQQAVKLAEYELKLAQERVAASDYGAKEKHVAELKENIKKNEEFLSNLDQIRKDSTDLVKKLEKEVKSFSKDKESRASKIEHMIADQKKKKSKIIDATKKARDEANKEQMQLEAAAEEIKAQQETMKKDEDNLQSERNGVEDCKKKVASKETELKRAVEERGKLQAQMDSNEKEHTELKKKLDEWKDKKSEAERMRLKVDHVIQTKKTDVQKAMEAITKLKAENPFIATDSEFFGKEGTEYDFQARDVAAETAKLEQMRVEQKALGNTVNKKVVGMYEKAEEEHRDLCKKRETIIQDKGKIVEVIADLDRKKTEAIRKTYEHVSRDFGNIFSTLLPNVSAKLAVPEGMKCTDGLEIKVAFQGVWKSSLTELSGGQKSLLALSLVLALLKYKPAPMYILDEIDAALDLSHTQNIGTMIKQHFPEAQFIVVSLKDGMFQNANVLFRTRFIDGCSRVERHILGAKAPALEAAAPPALGDKAAAKGEEEDSKAQKKGTKRKAAA